MFKFIANHIYLSLFILFATITIVHWLAGGGLTEATHTYQAGVQQYVFNNSEGVRTLTQYGR